METKQAIIIFEKMPIREIFRNGEKWIAAVDVAKCLEYANPSKAISDIIKLSPEKFEGFYLKEKTFDLGSQNGKAERGKNQRRETIFFNLEGVIMFLASTHMPKAIPFQRWAVKELKKVIQNIPDDLDFSIKKKRVFFTDELKAHGCDKPYHYINITQSMKKNLDIEKPKSECDLIEKMKIALSEDLARIKLIQENPEGYYQVKPICDNSAKNIKKITDKNNKKLDI